MPRPTAHLILAVLLLLAGIGLASIGPSERTLGTNVRFIYLHAAWVWTALIGLGAAAVLGLAGLAARRDSLHAWSIALGQSGTLFLLTYLPLSLLAMQLTWNGLYLDEPRWRVGLNLAVLAVLIQGANLLLARPHVGSLLNAAYFPIMLWLLSRTQEVMHPVAPILSSDSIAMKTLYVAVFALCLLSSVFLATWIRAKQR